MHALKAHFDLSADTTDIKDNYILKDTAHFAIKRTFYLLPDTDKQTVINKIKTIDIHQPIKITCTDTGMFNSSIYGDILYIKIEPNKQLHELHQLLRSALNNCVETKNPDMEDENYIPHLSMVYNIPEKLTPEITDYIKNTILPLEFNLEEVLLLKDFDTTKDERELIYRHILT